MCHTSAGLDFVHQSQQEGNTHQIEELSIYKTLWPEIVLIWEVTFNAVCVVSLLNYVKLREMCG